MTDETTNSFDWEQGFTDLQSALRVAKYTVQTISEKPSIDSETLACLLSMIEEKVGRALELSTETEDAISSIVLHP